MARCQNISPKLKKICAGDLRFKVSINNRAIVPPADKVNTENSQDYTLFSDVWAAIETKNTGSYQTLDGVALDETLIVTHVFYIRFFDGISTEQFIFYNGDNYKIIRATNIDERSLFLRLNCNLLGEFSKQAAQ